MKTYRDEDKCDGKRKPLTRCYTNVNSPCKLLIANRNTTNFHQLTTNFATLVAITATRLADCFGTLFLVFISNHILCRRVLIFFPLLVPPTPSCVFLSILFKTSSNERLWVCIWSRHHCNSHGSRIKLEIDWDPYFCWCLWFLLPSVWLLFF